MGVNQSHFPEPLAAVPHLRSGGNSTLGDLGCPRVPHRHRRVGLAGTLGGSWYQVGVTLQPERLRKLGLAWVPETFEAKECDAELQPVGSAYDTEEQRHWDCVVPSTLVHMGVMTPGTLGASQRGCGWQVPPLS